MEALENVYPVVEGEELSSKYVRNAVVTSNKRIALAGYRLADALFEIYGNIPPKGFLAP